MEILIDNFFDEEEFIIQTLENLTDDVYDCYVKEICEDVFEIIVIKRTSLNINI